MDTLAYYDAELIVVVKRCYNFVFLVPVSLLQIVSSSRILLKASLGQAQPCPEILDQAVIHPKVTYTLAYYDTGFIGKCIGILMMKNL